MDAIEMIKERRSIRNFKDEVVERKLIEEILEISRYSPSWCNYQVARYNLIENKEIINKLAYDGVNDFIYNIDTLKNARNVLVLSYVEGKSGKLNFDDIDYDSGSNVWEVFDSGIACQTFCLAAHAKGIGTVIMGVINDKVIAELINLPKDEKVAAVIVYGYPEGEHPVASPRKAVSEIARFL